MAHARQGVIIKKKATNKNRAKYKLKTQKIASQIAKNGVVINKYTYSKVIGRKKYAY